MGEILIVNRLALIAGLFFSLCSWSQSSERISFSHLTVNDGLSQNSVVHIAQDAQGYLWFATQDGLNRYDGRSFKVYPLQFEDITGDRSSLLGQLSFGDSSSIHALTKGGQLYKYSEAEDQFERLDQFNNLSSIYEDPRGQLWLGKTDGSLHCICLYESADYTTATDQAITKIKTYNSQTLFSSGSVIWQANQPSEKATPYLRLENREAIINDFAYDSKGNLWIATYTHGIFFKSSTSEQAVQFEGYGKKFALPTSLKIESFLIDSNDNIWFGTYGDGAFFIDREQKQLRQFLPNDYDPKAINYSDVISIYQDHTGIVWLGTDGAGLNYYDNGLLKFNGVLQSEAPNFANVDVARAITVDGENRIWIGTSGKGLTAYYPDSRKFNSFKVDAGKNADLPSDRIMSLYAAEHTLWIGFQEAGLAALDLRDLESDISWYSDPKDETIDVGTVWSIKRQNTFQIWLATRDEGLMLIDTRDMSVVKQFQHDPEDPTSIPENNVRALQVLEDGSVWVGTENQGVAFLPAGGDEFKRIFGSSFANVKSVYSDGEILWVGTNGNGLFRIDLNDNSQRRFSTDQGLPNNVIYGILPDDAGNLWLSSNRGISKFNTGNPDTVPVENYTIFDGLQSLEFNTGAYFKDPFSNTLYFGGLQGVNWFNPDDINKNSKAPLTAISMMEMHHEKVAFTPNMEFKAGENSFTFHFASLHFAQPERNQFKYMLENYDTDWSATTTNNLINYTNLPKGDYTFKLISGNYEGVWNEVPASLSFTILPAWYESNLAKLLYVVFGFLVILFTYRYFKWRWQMQTQLALEQQEAVRLKELDELKTRLYTNVAHEFRTPLTLISGPIKQLLRSKTEKPEDRELLEMIDHNSKRVVSLADELLELSRLRDGAVRLNIETHDLDAQLNDLIMPFKGYSGRPDLSLSHDLASFGRRAYDEDVLSKIITNLLSNAFKYASDNSQIQINAREKDSNLVFTIANASEKINSWNIEKLFDRHYRQHENLPGSGIGLSLLKELVELSKGSVSSTINAENKVEFTVALPLEEPKESGTIITNTAVDLQISQNGNSQEAPLILITEDDVELLDYTAKLFQKNGYKTITATQGKEAIKLATESIPDLIITDIRMPVQDGLEVLKTLKAADSTNHIPVFLLTAQAGIKDKLAGLELQADAYITKPFDPKLLLQQVKNELAAIDRLKEKFKTGDRLVNNPKLARTDQQPFIDRLTAVLQNSLAKPDFNASGLASELGMSRMQLHRKLKAVVGHSAQELLLNERLATARELLQTSELSVSEVAYTSGFNTPSYFSRCFKEKYELSPVEFRKKQGV